MIILLPIDWMEAKGVKEEERKVYEFSLCLDVSFSKRLT